jgi:hypothetical protein
MLQTIRIKEKCRKLLIWPLKRRKKKRGKYINGDELLDPGVLSWKFGNQILARILGFRYMGSDDFILNRAIEKEKRRRKKSGIIGNENLVKKLNSLKNTNSILKIIKTMKTEQIK